MPNESTAIAKARALRGIAREEARNFKLRMCHGQVTQSIGKNQHRRRV